MKALRWHGKKDVRVDTIADPQILDPRDIVIKVTSSAICGSDLHIYNGFIPTMEAGDVLGHEFMGEVVELGKDVKNLKLGDRVVDPSQRPSDVSYVEYDGTFGVIQTPDGPSIILGDNEQDAASIVLGMELYDRYNKGRSLTFTDFQREISRYLPQMQMGPLSPVSVEERIANDWPYWIGYFNPTPFGRIGNLPYHIK